MRIRAQGNSPTIFCVVLSILTVKKQQFLGSELHYKHPTEGEYIYQENTRARSFELLACVFLLVFTSWMKNNNTT